MEDDYAVFLPSNDIDAMIDPALMDPMLGVQYTDSSMLISDVHALSTPPHTITAQNSMMTPGPFEESIDPNIDPALMDPALLESGEDVGMTDDMHKLLPSALPKISTAAVGTPDVDKSFSPITAEDASADTLSKRPSEEKQQVHNSGSDSSNTAEQQGTNGVSYTYTGTEGHVSQTQSSSPQTAAIAVGPVPESDKVSQTEAILQPEQRDVYAKDNAAPTMQSDMVIKHEPIDIKMRHEVQVVPSVQDFNRADTALSSTSDPEEDASERLARELQAQEHGLRRRPSVRIS